MSEKERHVKEILTRHQGTKVNDVDCVKKKKPLTAARVQNLIHKEK